MKFIGNGNPVSTRTDSLIATPMNVNGIPLRRAGLLRGRLFPNLPACRAAPCTASGRRRVSPDAISLLRRAVVSRQARKAHVHLKRAIPNLFEYVDHPGLPKTTNALESFFGHVKDQLGLHGGLSEKRVDNFIKWYLFFNDEKKRRE